VLSISLIAKVARNSLQVAQGDDVPEINVVGVTRHGVAGRPFDHYIERTR
jgi:hypothetical protein